MVLVGEIDTALGFVINPKLGITAQLYAGLRKCIIELALKPGEALSEKELAARLGVSRTPAREALIRLADEGLVDIFPQRGTFVAPIRVAEVMEAQFLREALEIAVVRRAAERNTPEMVALLQRIVDDQQIAVARGDATQFLQLDEAFHHALSDSTALPRAWKVIQNVKGQLDRVRFLSYDDSGHLSNLHRQHSDIVDAIRQKNPDLASDRMRAHLQEVFETVRALLRDKPELFV